VTATFFVTYLICEFKKGWNFVYVKETGTSASYSASQSLKAGMKWFSLDAEAHIVSWLTAQGLL